MRRLGIRLDPSPATDHRLLLAIGIACVLWGTRVDAIELQAKTDASLLDAVFQVEGHVFNACGAYPDYVGLETSVPLSMNQSGTWGCEIPGGSVQGNWSFTAVPRQAGPGGTDIAGTATTSLDCSREGGNPGNDRGTGTGVSSTVKAAMFFSFKRTPTWWERLFPTDDELITRGGVPVTVRIPNQDRIDVDAQAYSAHTTIYFRAWRYPPEGWDSPPLPPDTDLMIRHEVSKSLFHPIEEDWYLEAHSFGRAWQDLLDEVKANEYQSFRHPFDVDATYFVQIEVDTLAPCNLGGRPDEPAAASSRVDIYLDPVLDVDDDYPYLDGIELVVSPNAQSGPQPGPDPDRTDVASPREDVAGGKADASPVDASPADGAADARAAADSRGDSRGDLLGDLAADGAVGTTPTGKGGSGGCSAGGDGERSCWPIFLVLIALAGLARQLDHGSVTPR